MAEQVQRLLNVPSIVNQHLDGHLEPREVVIDILTELRHFCEAEGVSFDDCEGMSFVHWRAESVRTDDSRRYLEGDTVDPACTGYIDDDGYLAHDGDRCPVHESRDVGTPWADSPVHAFAAPDPARVAAGDAEEDRCDDCGEFEDNPKHYVEEVDA